MLICFHVLYLNLLMFLIIFMLFFYLPLNIFNLFVFFFKHNTAYDLRISDWSSDVCSSDLQFAARFRQRDVEYALPPPDAFEEELKRDRRFPGAGATFVQIHAIRIESAAQNGVKPLAAGGDTLVAGLSLLVLVVVCHIAPALPPHTRASANSARLRTEGITRAEQR